MKSIAELIRDSLAIPPPEYAPDGSETVRSLFRRALAAHAEREREKAKGGPTQVEKELRDKRAEQDRTMRREEHEELQRIRTPQALRAMGLQDQEVRILEQLQRRPVVDLVEAWYASQKWFLVLGGDVGTGKTIAACSLLLHCKEPFQADYIGRTWLWAPRQGRLVKAATLARLSYYGSESKEAVEELSGVRLLIVDDVGAESSSETSHSTLSELIEARARRQVRTVITTNLSGVVFARHMGGRAMRRLREFGDISGVPQQGLTSVAGGAS